MGANYSRNQRWLYHDRTRRPEIRGRPPVTVCIASLFQWNYGTVEKPEFGYAGITASDRMVTAGDVQYEPAQLKIAFLTTRTLLLIAGEYSIHSEAINFLRKEIMRNPNRTTQNIALLYGRQIQEIKSRQAEDLFLAPIRLNTDTFIAQQKDMADSFIERITTQIQNFDGADIGALIVGAEEEGTHIYEVDSHGIISCWDDIGFAAIGIGAWHAKSDLMQGRYRNTLNCASALAAIFAAKKRAEIAPGVGKDTDIYIVNRLGHFRVWPHVEKKIHELYDAYDNQVAGLATQAIADLQAFMDNPPSEEAKSNEQQGNVGENPQADGGANPPAPEAARSDETARPEGTEKEEPGKFEA
jgi:20S proteasome alpha/beta subunit